MNAPEEEDIEQCPLLSILTPVAYAIDSASKPARRNRRRCKLKSARVSSDVTPVVHVDLRLASVSIVERSSSQTVTVRWSDARIGHFAEQIWCLGRSCADSFCVLTGQKILCGDKVFRPRIRQGVAPDQDRMILARAVDDALYDATSLAQTRR